jgi:hypothetical protein
MILYWRVCKIKKSRQRDTIRNRRTSYYCLSHSIAFRSRPPGCFRRRKPTVSSGIGLGGSVTIEMRGHRLVPGRVGGKGEVSTVHGQPVLPIDGRGSLVGMNRFLFGSTADATALGYCVIDRLRRVENVAPSSGGSTRTRPKSGRSARHRRAANGRRQSPSPVGRVRPAV